MIDKEAAMTGSYKTLRIDIDDRVARVTLDRPDVHNAFNEVVIEELTTAFKTVAALADKPGGLRVVILTGTGKSFCAGADLNWMKKMAGYSYDENVNDALALADLMYAVYTCPLPTIARVNGSAFGGGVGLASACDIVVASEKARFSLSEVKLGLVPACIAPYVIERVGPRNAREYFLTGVRIGAEEALKIGVANRVVPEDGLDAAVDEYVQHLLSSSPQALRWAKELVHKTPKMQLAECREFNAGMIAKLRVSEEGQEGISAFFETRKPNWA
jgi:methylglutaconyl-CoA hydratase